MKFYDYATLLVTIFILLPLAHGKTGPSGDIYNVYFDQKQPERIHVEAKIILHDSLLYMSRFGPMPERWPQFVRNLTVKDGMGRPLALTESEGGGWKISGAVSGQPVQIEYQVALEHESLDWPGGIDGVAYIRDWGIMASGRSLFVMNGHDRTDISIRFSYPPGWKVSVPWEASTGSDDSYLAKNLMDLQESFIFAGTHREVLMERDGFFLKFILGGEAVLKEQDRYQQVAEGVMDYYINQMGGVPKFAPGFNAPQSMVIISESDAVDGEVIGNHLSMFMNPDGDNMQQMMGWFMFAHEFFHLWNGKTLRFENTQTEWFKEGISNYYTMKALYQIGFADEQTVLMMLDGLFYQRYIKDPGYGSVAPAQAASGFSKDNHWGIIYGGGLFTGIAMDMVIRKQTDNARSLDDLMRHFYREFGGTEKRITSEDILQNANRIGNTEFAHLLDSSIEGTDPVPLAKYLVYAGMETETDSGHLVLRHKESKTQLQRDIWKGFLGSD